MLSLSRPSGNEQLGDRLRAFIRADGFPCVGAKSAVAKGQLHVVTGFAIDSGWNDLAIHDELTAFVRNYQRDRTLFTSFAVVFEGPEALSEVAFETAMWERLQSLSDKDSWRGQPHDDSVSADPADAHFALSFGGEAFFVVGLHPNASRKARAFDVPVLIFNLRDQFDTLREQGRYEKMRQTILDRDMSFSGSINPMLSRHGELSEARQYSGRAVDEAWQCPFNPVRRDAA